jgi:hypothetical protein
VNDVLAVKSVNDVVAVVTYDFRFFIDYRNSGAAACHHFVDNFPSSRIFQDCCPLAHYILRHNELNLSNLKARGLSFKVDKNQRLRATIKEDRL